MKLTNISRYVKDDKAWMTANVESGSFPEPQILFFAYPRRFIDYLPATADPFFPALLIPSMVSGEPLEIIPPVSTKLLKNQSTLQAIFASWFPSDLTPVQVIANDRQEVFGEKKPNATFFSLGVDSMYTMLKYLPRHCSSADRQVSALIYMKGLELPLSTYAHGQDQQVVQTMRKVAANYKLDLVVGETNIRDVFPLVWEHFYSGAGLAATALSLSVGFGNVYIPSSHSYAYLSPSSSSPLTDNLWSTEQTAIIHDGAEVERAQKLAGLIAEDPFALDHLRVCIDNQGGGFNCGKCWKCVRTMITLEIIGRLKDAASFPAQLPENYSMELRTYKRGSLKFAMENLKLARQYGNADLEKILQRETRIGQLDVFRDGKPIGYLVNEVLHYFWVKAGRRLFPGRYSV